MKHLAIAVLAVLALTGAARADYLSQRKEAVALAQANQHDKALAAYIALAQTPDISAIQKTDALRLAVTAACRLKQYDLAGELAQGIPLEPYLKAAQIEVLAVQRQWQAIIDQFGNEAIDAWPSAVSGPSLLSRGRAFSALKRGQDAENDFKQAVALISQRFPLAEVGIERGDNFLANLKNPDEALASYRRTIEVMNDSGSYLYFSAVIAAAGVLRDQQKFDEAMRTLVVIDAQKLGGYWGGRLMAARAAVHQAQGHKDQAITCYQAGLALPNLPDHLTRDLQQKLDALQATPSTPVTP